MGVICYIETEIWALETKKDSFLCMGPILWGMGGGVVQVQY